jgi:hypothetical protein
MEPVAREASKLLDSDGERAPRLRFDPREPRHGGVPAAPNNGRPRARFG